MTTSVSTTSEVFVCNSCLAPVSLQLINSDDLAYCCTNAKCGRAVHVDCPQGLALAEDAALVLHARELRSNILAADKAGNDPFDAVVRLMAVDASYDIGIAALINVTIDVVKHEQKRTAVLSAMRVDAIAA